jgi:hypothetical protein
METWALHMLGKSCNTELQPQPNLGLAILLISLLIVLWKWNCTMSCEGHSTDSPEVLILILMSAKNCKLLCKNHWVLDRLPKCSLNRGGGKVHMWEHYVINCVVGISSKLMYFVQDYIKKTAWFTQVWLLWRPNAKGEPLEGYMRRQVPDDA